jgi:hypothetical protein
LKANLDSERRAFEESVRDVVDPEHLDRVVDFFERSGAHELSEILPSLPDGSQARDFALVAGMRAARAEYVLQGGRPTKVPNTLSTISVEL